jgi:hypothetical protein
MDQISHNHGMSDGGHSHGAVQERVKEEQIEAAFWEMDARVNGTGEWKGRPQSQRDAFKWAVRNLLAR